MTLFKLIDDILETSPPYPEQSVRVQTNLYQSKGIMLNRIAWPSILELSYKRSIFYVQVRAGTVSNSISKIGFLCPTSGTAKRIWRISMEHHHFFRKEVSKPEGGSKLLLKSRTQAELLTELDQNISRVSGKLLWKGEWP